MLNYIPAYQRTALPAIEGRGFKDFEEYARAYTKTQSGKDASAKELLERWDSEVKQRNVKPVKSTTNIPNHYGFFPEY